MDFEFRLRFAAPEPSAVAEVLRRLPEVRESSPPGTGFDFGYAGGNWPRATAQVEDGGIYYCDHCSPSGGALLGNLVAALGSFVAQKRTLGIGDATTSTASQPVSAVIHERRTACCTWPHPHSRLRQVTGAFGHRRVRWNWSM